MSPASASIPPGLAAGQCCSTVAWTPLYLSPPPAPRSLSLPKCPPRMRVSAAQVRFPQARPRSVPQFPACQGVKRPRRLPQEKSILGETINEWSSVEPLGFPTTLGTPASEQVVHPSQKWGDNSWGGGRGQPSSCPTRELRAPCHCVMGRGAQGIHSALRPSLGLPARLCA